MIGHTLSHFRVVQKLGEGGMGEVYLAEDTQLCRKVALKVLPQQFAADPKRKKRFVREAVAASALTHPNVAVVYEAGEADDGTAFISMEYVPGETLADLLQRQTLSFRQITDLGIQIADALDEAGHHGIVHRDLKPGNVMLDRHGRAKVLDFGIAKVREPDSEGLTSAPTASLDTAVGVLVGTAAYMSPEQAEGRSVDHRSDLFSLGALLYEMVSGKRAFAGASALETLAQILQTRPQRLVSLRKDCPAELERIIFKCLEKHPEDRYQSARELLLDLQSLAERFAAAGTVRRGAWRNAWIAALAVVAIAMAIWIPRTRMRSPTNVATRSIGSVAVLPFVNMAAAENEFIADGISEEIINALAQLPDLKVVSRTSAFAFKGRNVDAREIGEKLQVDSLVEGSVRRSGDRLRVTAQLISVRDGFHLWSDTYEREMADIFAVEDEIAGSVARMLQAKLTPGKPLVTVPTRSVEAYELYLKARPFVMVGATRKALDQAMSYYRQALARDPAFAPGLAGIAEAYSLMDHALGTAPLNTEETYRLAVSAAQRALELDPDSVEAHAALGHIFMHQGKFTEAEWNLKRAIELKPNSAAARQWYSVLLREMGRRVEAETQITKARDVDPLSAPVHYLAVSAYYFSGKLDQAIEAGERGIELAPNSGSMYFHLAEVYALKGRHAEAEKLVEREVDLPDPPADLQEQRAYLLVLANRRADALSLLDRISREKKNPAAQTMALAYAALGQKDQAIEWYERLIRDGPNYARVNIDLGPYPAFDALRADSRYLALRRQLGLPN